MRAACHDRFVVDLRAVDVQEASICWSPELNVHMSVSSDILAVSTTVQSLGMRVIDLSGMAANVCSTTTT